METMRQLEALWTYSRRCAQALDERKLLDQSLRPRAGRKQEGPG
jgi:hypothetical protein